MKAKDKLEKSMVADNKSGKSVQSEVRTSSGMFLDKRQVRPSVSTVYTTHSMHALLSICEHVAPSPTDGQSVADSNMVFLSSCSARSVAQDPVVSRIEERIAAWTFLPQENAENMQVLRYEPGQKYEPHFDYFHDRVNQARGGHRYATVLMYLSTVREGGETVFPNAKVGVGS